MTGRLVFLALWLSLLQLPADGAESTDATPRPYQKLAEQIAEIMQQLKESTIIIGHFSGPSRNDGGGGVIGQEIARELALSKGKIKVDADAKLEISGSYTFDANKNGRLQMEIEVNLKDSATGKKIASTGETVVEDSDHPHPSKRTKPSDDEPQVKEISRPVITAKAVGDREFLAMAATTVEFSPEKSGKEREHQILTALKDGPKTNIHPRQGDVRATPESPFGLELLQHERNGDYVAKRPEIDERGQAMVKLSSGDRYAIRLRNDADFEVAANVTVDGISVFALSKSQTGQFLVPPHDSVEIRGWIINAKQARQFLVQRDTPELRKLLGSPDRSQVGAVTVTFARAWRITDPVPEGEGTIDTRSAKGSVRTGAGKWIDQKVESVERQFGRVRTCITIRYVKPQ